MYQDQEELIKHLCRYRALSYEGCLHLLDPDELSTSVERSYIFRPLTRLGYLKKHKNGAVTILAKGRRLFPDVEPLVTTGGDRQNLERVMQVSRMAMLLAEIGAPSFGELVDRKGAYFIPSACWRAIAPSVLSTTRFLGMLMMPDECRYAVYDIGDGNMERQSLAEGSLFYTKRNSYKTSATGMLFVCSNEKRIEVAQYIIRQTMWNRKQLLKRERSERNKPARWSRAPIRMKAKYGHVYLTTYKGLRQSIIRIYEESEIGPLFCPDAKDHSNSEGYYEDWPYRYYCNPACDLLKFVKFFAAAKGSIDLYRSMPELLHKVRYAACIRSEDWPILEMYPDVMEMEGLKVYEYPD